MHALCGARAQRYIPVLTGTAVALIITLVLDNTVPGMHALVVHRIGFGFRVLHAL